MSFILQNCITNFVSYFLINNLLFPSPRPVTPSQREKRETMGDSTEVGPLEILRVSFLLGNGQAPSDIPSDTKNSIRVVH